MRMTAPLEVGMTVKDLARVRAFYEGVLGLSFVSDAVVSPENSTKARLSDHGYRVVRLQTQTGERIKLLAPNRPPAPRSDKTGQLLDHHSTIYLTFIIDDINATVTAALAAGATLLNAEPKTEMRPGIFLAFLRDPEGHVIELVQHEDITTNRNNR